MGRAAFSLLKGRPKTVHLFNRAPRDYRIERAMKAHNTAGLQATQAMVEESDRRRAKFIRDMVGTEWTDARNYDLCLDSSIVKLSEGVLMVTGFVESAFR
jgi:cytidylate kinase